MALTETWINLRTLPLLQLSPLIHFSHTPARLEGWGTGLLISNEWKFELLPSPTGNSSFESHAITITHPAKIHVVVVYRPQVNWVTSGGVGCVTLKLPEDGTPLVLLGDFNIHLENPRLLTSTLFSLHLTSNECLLRLLTNQVTDWTSSTHATAPLTNTLVTPCTPQTTSSSLLTSH